MNIEVIQCSRKSKADELRFILSCNLYQMTIARSLFKGPSCDMGCPKKKVLRKSEEKMHQRMKMTSQRAENLVHVQQHHGKCFNIRIFF